MSKIRRAYLNIIKSAVKHIIEGRQKGKLLKYDNNNNKKTSDKNW